MTIKLGIAGGNRGDLSNGRSLAQEEIELVAFVIHLMKSSVDGSINVQGLKLFQILKI
ncbi:MAG: hypothetical protein Ct9H300mP19_14740 [Dehalococcoidia bacterium]|nr:MAG: hypothetical protein Ct9H300mP19_14740 [Dehalococcoidia bacterium]